MNWRRLMGAYPQAKVVDHTRSAIGSAAFVSDGGDPSASTPEEYAANIEREEGRWAALIKKLGLKIE
jgi:tripartite-type tricarboxylate transporter receptor subunit TctC